MQEIVREQVSEYSPFFNAEMETIGYREQVEIWEAKLAKQVAYVYESSPFYKAKLKEAGLRPEQVRTLRDLQRVPFTGKDEIRRSQEQSPPLGNHLAAPLEKVVRVHSSSGTTGRPTYVGITKHDRAVWTEIVARCFYAMGARPNDVILHAVGLTFFVGGLPMQQAIEEIGATFVPIGTGASDRVVSTGRDLGATAIHCTPSYAIYLTEYVRNKVGMDPKDLGIHKFLCGAEPGIGNPAVRKQIEDAWAAKACEGMGNADMAPSIFGECYEQQGMHYCAQEFVIPEIIDPDTGENLEIEEGVTGELVYTAIDREACPLLRFRTRDRVTVWTNPCGCGRTSFRLRCIGRTDDMLIVLGVNVFPSAIKDVATSMRPRTTGEIQVVLDRPGPKVEPPMRVKVEYGEQAGDLATLKKQIEERLREKLVFRADVELVAPGTLPRFEAKAKLVRRLYEE